MGINRGASDLRIQRFADHERKKRIVLNVTLPTLLTRLRENSRKINQYLLLYAASVDSFDEVIGLCEANVRALRRRLGFRQSRFSKDLLKSISRYKNEKSPNAARDLYNELQQVIQEVANRVEERRIAGS